jgi:hypothetical protein
MDITLRRVQTYTLNCREEAHSFIWIFVMGTRVRRFKPDLFGGCNHERRCMFAFKLLPVVLFNL